MIDWNSTEMHIFGDENADLPYLEGHIWLNSSGTFKKKWIALAKKAFLTSADAVNRHLKITSNDSWLQPLPNHHVGGLSIWARAHLTQSKVYEYPDVTKKKWDAGHFYQTLTQTQATITSLVPTQLYDLVNKNLTAPKSLRLILIGGGYLADHLYNKAHALGWPIIPTYGCTECCSQIATGSLQDPRLCILPHIEAHQNETLQIRSQALLTAIYDGDLIDPKINGWYDTGDIVELSHNYVKPLGRKDEQFKIRGEKVLLGPLKQLLEELSGDCAVTLNAIPDERLGHKLILVAEESVDTHAILSKFNQKVPPYVRIDTISTIKNIKRNAMGKIN